MISETIIKKVKNNKTIAIGGMIAAGKTTLSDALSKKINAKVLYEINDNDNTQMILLNDLYERKPDAGTVFQIYQLLKRINQYEKAAKLDVPIILDRVFFEDRLFAHENMLDSIINYCHYDRFWEEKANEIIEKVGLPQLYVILKIDWDTFKQRVFKRGRKSEIDNFALNEKYFQKLNSVYVPHLEKTCIRYGIPYLILEANMDLEEKIKLILDKIE